MDTRGAVWRVGIGIAGAAVLLVAVTIVVVHTAAFSRFVLSKVIQQANAATGARVQIQTMKLTWAPFAADFYGVVARGSKSASDLPLVSAEHLHIGLRLTALLRHGVELSDITLERPKMTVHVDARGNSNLPERARTSGGRSRRKYNVSIEHVSIQNGTLDYNDQKIPLNVELNDFRLQADADAPGNYRGMIAYDYGWLAAKKMNKFAHNARLDFKADREQLVMHPLVLSVGGSSITVNATMRQFDHPQVDGSYEGLVETAELGYILKNAAMPVGRVRLNGSLAYHDQDGQTFWDGLQLAGKLSSQELGFNHESGRVQLTDVAGSYEMEHGTLKIESLRSAVLGGQVSASGQIAFGGTGSAIVAAQIRDVSLSQMSSAVPAQERERVRFVGRLNADVRANWTKAIRDLAMRAHLEIAGPNQVALSKTQTSNPEISVNGMVDATYNGAHETATFRPSHLRTGKTNVMISGQLSRRASLNVGLDSEDLHELTAMLTALLPATKERVTGQRASTYEVYGSAKFNGKVMGSLSAPQIHGDVAAMSLQVQGSKWQTLRATLDASPSRISARNGLLQSEGPGQITFSVETGLKQWSYMPSSPISVQASWKRLSVSELEHLAHADYPANGILSGDVNIQGSQLHLAGHGTVNLVQASLWRQQVNSITANFQGNKETIHSNAEMKLPAGTATVEATYSPSSEHYQVKFNAPHLRLDQIPSLQKAGTGGIKGSLTLNAQGEGTIKQPQLHATIDAPQLQAADQTLSQLHAQIDVAGQRASVTVTSSVSTAVGQASIRAKADAGLTGDYPAQGNVEIHGVPVAALLASRLKSSASSLNGTMDLRGTLNGPLKDPKEMQASVEIPSLELGYQEVEIANEGPLRFEYRNGMVNVQQAHLKGSGTDLSVQGTIPVIDGSSMNVAANGVIDVSLLQLLSSDTHSSGQIKVRVQANGKLSEPSVQGQLQIVNASIGSESLPVDLTSANGVLDITGNRIEIRQFQGKAGGGTVTSQGIFTIGKVPSFAMSVNAKAMRIHPNGIHSTLDGNLQLNGTTEKALLSGKVVVDRLSFQQASDLSTIIGQFSGTPSASTPSAFATNTKLNIAVQSSRELSLANSQFSIAGSANLTVTNTLAEPVILGRIALTGGEVFFLSKRFEVQNGTIVFTNPVRTEPVLNLFVATTVEQYNITISLWGPVDRLKTNYTSDPSLPPLDIINLLAFGQTTAEQASNAATPAAMGAENVVAQGVAGQVAKGIQSVTGISQLTLDPLAGNNQNPGAQIAVQQRVSGHLLLTFSTNVTSTQNQAVQLEYQPKRQVTISVLRDEYGGYGLDVKWHKIF